MTNRFDLARCEATADAARHDELLLTLIVPEDGSHGEYTDRHLEAQWVQLLNPSSDGNGGSVTGSTGWTAHAPAEVFDRLTVGSPYAIEVRGATLITGWLIDGTWFHRKTDEDLRLDHERYVADSRARRQAELDSTRDDLQARENALPDWIRARLDTFHREGAEDFERDGWSYELAVCELAVLYADLGPAIAQHDSCTIRDIESPAITEYAHANGTTGNMHGMALALAKRHVALPEETMAGTPSALTPLTGSPFYAQPADEGVEP